VQYNFERYYTARILINKMPLKHSPKKTNKSGGDKHLDSQKANANISSLDGLVHHHYDSEPDVSYTEEPTCNVTSRYYKRRALQTPPKSDTSFNMDVMMKEMRSLFSAQTIRQDQRFEDMKKCMDQQCADIKESINFLSERYDILLTEIESLRKDKIEDKKCIKNLEDKIEQLERQNRATGLEIRNIPMKAGETKTDLAEIVVNLSQILGAPILHHEIKDVFRINAKNQNKPIIAEFTTVIAKEKIINAHKIFNKGQQGKLCTSDLKIEGPKMLIYMSESLTSKIRRIHFMARNFAAQHDYKFCWTSYGRVYLRKADGTQKIQIVDDGDLLKLKQKD
jgi:hypothetical protein